MSQTRFKALAASSNRVPVVAASLNGHAGKISDFFGVNVFDKDKMQKFLSKEVYKQVMEATETGKKIDRKVAERNE